MFRLLFLGNGWADCVEIWYALGNPLVTAYAVVTDGVSLHVRTCRPRFCISGTAWPIEFNFCVWVSSPYLSAFHKSWVGYLCTCARADRASVSQKRLDRLCSNCVQIWYVGWASLSTCFPQVSGGWGISARAHVHSHLRVSGSEWSIVLKFDVWQETQ